MGARVTLEEYLGGSKYKHCEWVDGVIERLNLGTIRHGMLMAKVGRYLSVHFDGRSDGYVAARLHCRMEFDGRLRFRLPDVAVVIGDADPDESYLQRAPDLAVEIRSPEDSITWLLKKAGEYFANGSKLVWIVLPEEESVWAVTAGGKLEAFVKGETLGGGDVLPGFALAVDDLFPNP